MNTRSYWYLMGAQTVAALGDTFGILAIQWILYEKTGSTVAMATLAVAQFMPEFVIRFLFTPLIDRVNRVRLMALLDMIRFLTFGALVLLGFLGKLEVWQLYGTAVIIGTCSALFAPASMATVPSLLKNKQLVRGISLLDTFRNSALLLGPAIAGFVITRSGTLTSLAVNSVCYGISSLLIFLLSKQHSNEKNLTVDQRWSAYLHEALEGITFFKFAPGLFLIMVFAAVGNMSSVAISSVMVPFAQEQLHMNAAELGILSSASSGGILAGSLLISILGDIRRRRLLILGSVLARGLLIVAFGLNSNKWIAVVLISLFGLCSPFFGSISSGLFGRLVPEELRGRVMSIRLLIGGSLQPVGSMAGGTLAAVLGLPMMFVSAGLFPLIAAFAGFFIPSLRGLDGDVGELSKNIKMKTTNSPAI